MFAKCEKHLCLAGQSAHLGEFDEFFQESAEKDDIKLKKYIIIADITRLRLTRILNIFDMNIIIIFSS